MPKVCQFLIFTCQRVNKVSMWHSACKCFNLVRQCAKRRANFSSWRANLPKVVSVFQTFLLRNAEENFYTLLLFEKFFNLLDIIVTHIVCILSYIRIVLHFISIVYVIFQKSVWNFSFSLFFCFLVTNTYKSNQIYKLQYMVEPAASSLVLILFVFRL